jgi:hypothetical protein
MSMYVELLSTVLEDESEDQNEDQNESGLFQVALDCRSRLLDIRWFGTATAQEALAIEVAYDRALIRLCTAHGIDVAPARFAHPQAERDRLEQGLATLGIHLDTFARRRH